MPRATGENQLNFNSFLSNRLLLAKQLEAVETAVIVSYYC